MSRWLHTLTWRRNTLDVDIPEGWPTERGEMLIEITGDSHEAVKRLCDSMWWPGSGYSVHAITTDLEARPPRRLSEETKAGIRRKNLRRRMMAKNPLFAEAAIDAAFIENPEHYGGIRP